MEFAPSGICTKRSIFSWCIAGRHVLGKPGAVDECWNEDQPAAHTPAAMPLTVQIITSSSPAVFRAGQPASLAASVSNREGLLQWVTSNLGTIRSRSPGRGERS